MQIVVDALRKKGKIFKKMQEIEYQIAKAETEKEKVQKKYDEAMKELNHVLERLEKIKNVETLRCQNKEK